MEKDSLKNNFQRKYSQQNVAKEKKKNREKQNGGKRFADENLGKKT